MSTGDKADSLEELAPPSVVSSTSFTSSDVDDEGFGTTSYSASASDVESTASSRTVTEVRHKRYVVTSTAARLPSVPVDPGPEPSDAPTADIVALNARFMYYVDRVRFLELENKTLRHNVTELEIKSVSPEMYKTFQQEIDRGRQKVADLSAQRSQLQVEVQKMEREMREVNHKVFEESRSRKEALRELEKLRTELYDTKKAYKDAQDNLRLKAQEQEFKARTHEQEVKEVQKEVLNISIELEKLRNENTKLEIGVLGATGELHQFIQGGEGNAQLQAEVAEISHNSSTEVTQYVSMLEQREVELESLHHSLEEQRREYEKLMHMKLDLELALKHHGLEFTTIQYDVHDWSPSDRKSSTPKGTPIRRRPLHEMSHSNKKLKTDHHSSVDGSFLSNEAASISAGGGSPSSLAGNASGTGGQTGYIITENYTFEGTSSQQQTRQGQVVGGGGESKLVVTEAHIVDDPGPTDPKRVLTPSGEYVVASATKTVRRSGETVDTTMGDDSVYGLRAEGSNSNHDTSNKVQPGSSGPRRVLTASGEYVVVTSSSGDQTKTTSTAEGQPGLSGQKSVLTSSGEYVVVTSSSEDQTTTTGRAEDHPGLPGTKRVLTASGEYVVETSSSEYQTSTTTKGGVGSGQVNVGAGTYSVSTGSSRRMDEATSTVRKRTDYIEGVETSFSSHQETQTMGNLSAGGEDTTLQTTEFLEDSDAKTSMVVTEDVGLRKKENMQGSVRAATIQTDRNAQGDENRSENIDREHSRGTEHVATDDDVSNEGDGSFGKVVQERTMKGPTFSRNTQMDVHMWGKFPIIQTQMYQVAPAEPVSSPSSATTMTTSTSSITFRSSQPSADVSESDPQVQTLTKEENNLPNSQLAVHLWGRLAEKKRSSSVKQALSEKAASRWGRVFGGNSSTSHPVSTITATSTSAKDDADGGAETPHTTIVSPSSAAASSPEGQDDIGASSTKSGRWRFFGRHSTATKTNKSSRRSSQSEHYKQEFQRASGMQQMESTFWGKSVRRENTRTSLVDTSSTVQTSWWSRLFAGRRTAHTTSPTTIVHTEQGSASSSAASDHKEEEDVIDASSEKSGWWRFLGRRSTSTSCTASRSSQPEQHTLESQRASGLQQMETNYWGKSARSRGENTRTDQDEIDASAKSGGWRCFGRQSTSTTSSTSKHSSQSVQHQLQAHHASGMQQMGSNFWGKAVSRETTRTADRRGGLLWRIISWPFSRAVKGQQHGIDETDATTVSTTTTTTSGSSSTTGRKATSEGLHLADGTKRSSRSCLPLIGRLCVWLLPLLFLLLLLFFLLSSLLPGGMMGMFLGLERGGCHLQNSFRQSWRLMLRHKNPPPI